MADKIYCNSDSDVLKNKMGIRSKEMLQCQERRLTMLRILHPFREGNGRSQREFIRALALHIGYVVNFAKVSKEEMIRASEDSFLCDYGRMERLFSKCIRQRN